MKETEFESLLDVAVEQLRSDIQRYKKYRDSNPFENHVRKVLQDVVKGTDIVVNPSYHPHVFPDISVNGFGVEVKSNQQDSWQSVANSILETMRDPSVGKIYVIFGKMGGLPDVRWGVYEECVHHVRISHAPRFCLDMGDNVESLFSKIKISYENFAKETHRQKMIRVREYARSRLKPGERLWWMENEEHTLSLSVKRYNKLSHQERIRLRAEAAVLCPQICAPRTKQDKYDAVAHYLLTYHGILSARARDMFSAGSVVLPSNQERGGLYIQRALKVLEPEMEMAAGRLESELLCEYWNISKAPENTEERLITWLQFADNHAQGKWKPSEVLFKKFWKS